jgi:hypothetical protein
MHENECDPQIESVAASILDRRNFFRKAGYFGLGAAVSGLALTSPEAHAQQNTAQINDTIEEIFTAFLIAEDLATTFYYNGLVGGVIQDPNLAGPGGTARRIGSMGNAGNVAYLRAAYGQEATHANLFRGLAFGSSATPSGDPHQTFYFPTGTFDTLTSFLSVLDTLENAFIGAYIVALQELTYKAEQAAMGKLTGNNAKYTSHQYEVQVKRFASILGVECEHRVLGRVIGSSDPANNFNYEGLDGLTSIYNGSASAVVALTPFLTSSTGPGYSLETAYIYVQTLRLPSTGTLINA